MAKKMKKEITKFLLLSFLCLWQAKVKAQVQIPISNGNFETTSGSNFANWSNKADSGGNANYSIETSNLIVGSTKALKAQIISLGTKGWNTSTINNYGFQVIAGSRYTVSFYAKKESSNSSSIRLVYQSTGNFQSKEITLTDTWQLYTHTFTVSNNASDMKVKFWYLQPNTTYYLDQVSVLDVDGEDTVGNDVKFNVSETFQTVDGFGAGIKRGTKQLYRLDPVIRQQVEEYCFKDLEVNMIRFFVYHSLEPINDNLSPYLLDENELDWTGYESGPSYKNHYVGEALNNAFKLSVNGFDHVIGNCNSAPGWLKTNGSHNGGGTLIPGGEDEYSEFLFGFLKGMKSRYNIDVTAISPTNEPDYEVSYESMNLSPNELIGVVKSLKDKLVTESMSDVKIISPECFRVVANNAAVSATNYINEMFTDAEVKSAVDVVATHTYADGSHNADWSVLKTAASGKPVWVTESAYLSSQDAHMADAAYYAKWILRGFNEGGLTAYMAHVIFQIKNATSDNDQHGLVMVDADGVITLPKRYFVMKHFANLVKKGFKLVSTNTNIEKVMVGGFISPDGSKFVLQILNEGETRDVVLDVPQGTLGVGHYLTSNAEADAFSLTNDITFNQGDEEITLNMPSMSMHSIVYDIDSSLSTAENTLLKEAKLFPNPANQELTISFGGSGDYQLSVYQLNGVKVLGSQSVSAPSGKLDISGLSSGLYFVKINSKKQGLNTTLKFIKR
jgi:O-glycosyl hydrolase